MIKKKKKINVFNFLKELSSQMTLKQHNMNLEKQNVYFKAILHDFGKDANFCSCFQARNIQAIKHDFEKVKFLL